MSHKADPVEGEKCQISFLSELFAHLWPPTSSQVEVNPDLLIDPVQKRGLSCSIKPFISKHASDKEPIPLLNEPVIVLVIRAAEDKARDSLFP